VQQVLRDQLGAVKVTCGYNYRFGAGGVGDAALLTRLCDACGIAVTVVDAVSSDGCPVSSTAIRQAIAAGDMTAARRLLGRPYRLQQPVIQGQHLGRRLGMPTINQLLPTGVVHPRYGVYASCVEIDGEPYPAVTNIGLRPTVGTDRPLAETYILGFSGDLYDTAPAVYPLSFLREEQTFPTLAALQEQVQRDAQEAAALFEAGEPPVVRAVFFDFDDTLDDRDAAFRRGLEAFLTYYYPSLSPEELVRRREEMFRFNRSGYGSAITYDTMILHYLTQWPAEVTADQKAALWRFYRGFAAGGQPHPDVLPTLTALRQQGYLIGIVTNGNTTPQSCKMDYSGLRPYVDLIVLAGEEVAQKPDPRIFRLAAARLGVACRQCVFVGDHPIYDLQAARHAGFAVIRKEAGHPPDHPFHTLPIPSDVPAVRHIAEVPTVLEALVISADT